MTAFPRVPIFLKQKSKRDQNYSTATHAPSSCGQSAARHPPAPGTTAGATPPRRRAEGVGRLADARLSPDAKLNMVLGGPEDGAVYLFDSDDELPE